MYYLKVLDNVQNVNNFKEVDEITLPSNIEYTLYVRLYKNIDTIDDSMLRFIPPANSYLEIHGAHIDTNKRITRIAIQPFSQDLSIFAVTIYPPENIGNGLLKATLYIPKSNTPTTQYLKYPCTILTSIAVDVNPDHQGHI